MHCDYIFYCMLNDMIKNLKKYQKSLKYLFPVMPFQVTKNC